MVANYFFLLSDKVIRMVFGLISNILLVTYLSPSDLGTWNYILSVASIASAISIFSGLDAVVIRDFAITKSSERGRIIGAVMLLRLAASSLAMVGSFLFVMWTNEWTIINLIIIISISFFTQIFHSIDYFFQSQMLPKYSAFVLNITASIGFAAKIGFILSDLMTLEYLCWILVAESCLLSIGYVWLVISKFKDIAPNRWKFDFKKFSLYLNRGVALLGAGLIGVLIARISTFQIDSYFGRENVAVFGFYVLIIEAVLMANYTLVNTYFSRVIVKYSSPRGYAKELNSLFRRQIYLWLVLGVGALIVGNAAFNIINPVYRESIKMILISLPVTIIFIVNFYLLQFLIIPQSLERHQLLRMILGLFVLSISNLLFFNYGSSVILVVASIALSQLSMLMFTIIIYRKKIFNFFKIEKKLYEQNKFA